MSTNDQQTYKIEVIEEPTKKKRFSLEFVTDKMDTLLERASKIKSNMASLTPCAVTVVVINSLGEIIHNI